VGAQNVTTWEKMAHASVEEDDGSEAGEEDICECGVMRGGGATPRSGRVRVFALRIVGPCLRLVVGMGISSLL
jgi:hypothetical protein